jgi:hypothetical protein
MTPRRLAGAAAVTALAALAASLTACSGRKPSAAGAGRQVAAGVAQALRPSPDGSELAWLTRCARPPVPGLPLGVAACDLVVAPTAGGAPVRVAEGVSTLEVGFAWGPDGALAALADHDHAAGAGALVLRRRGGEPERLASGVTFYAFGPEGELGYVAGGELHVGPPGARPAPVRGAGRVATFDFDPSRPGQLLARGLPAYGGVLLRVTAGAATPETRAPAGDYAWAPGGRFSAATVRGEGGLWDLLLWRSGNPRAARLGHDVQAFAFDREGTAVAFLAGMSPGRPGDLHAATLAGVEDPARVAAPVVAHGVGEMRWAPAAQRLAWLQDFDPRVRSGTLGVGGPGRRAATFGKNVTAFDLSPDATQVAWLEHVTAGGYSVDLKVAPAAGGEGVTVARGSFGFEFSPDGRWLYYRSACVRNAEACDLHRVPAAGPAPGVEPERIAAGVKSFDFDRARPGRILLGYARMDAPALDLALWQEGRLTALDEKVLPGSARFLPPDGRRVAWVVVEPKRAGVYVADAP